jgi:GxxExxY protein
MLHEDLTDRILRCAIDVHKVLGPTLPERTYQSAMAIEMFYGGLRFEREPSLPVTYRGVPIGHHRPDFIVEETVVLEIKSVARFESVFYSQVVTYLKVSGLPVGLLLNFNVSAMSHGIKRFING